MLMRPMATAPAEALRVSVGSAQKGEGQKYAAKPVRQSQAITAAKGWPGIVLPTRKRAVAACPATQCHLRSPLRSEDCPDTITLTSPQTENRPREHNAERSD